jgi:hypothetical protein
MIHRPGTDLAFATALLAACSGSGGKATLPAG